MSNEGKGKVRYVGGWVVIKLIFGHKRYIMQNLASSNPHVRTELNQRYSYMTILESLLAQSTNLHSSTIFEETLTVTDMKQYRKNSLAHISDAAFQYFNGFRTIASQNSLPYKTSCIKAQHVTYGDYWSEG